MSGPGAYQCARFLLGIVTVSWQYARAIGLELEHHVLATLEVEAEGDEFIDYLLSEPHWLSTPVVFNEWTYQKAPPPPGS